MTPNFPQTNKALNYLLTYFKIGRISEQIEKFGGGLNLSYLDSMHKATINSFQYMEDEIYQNYVGSLPFIQRELYDYLGGWLNSYEFNDGFKVIIENKINEENENEEIRFKEEMDRDEQEYNKTIPEGVKYGEEYEVIIPKFHNFFTKQISPERKEIRVFQFVTSKQPKIINKAYLSQYLDLVYDLICRFKTHSEKYVLRYLNGEMPTMPLEGLTQSNIKVLELPEDSNRLKVSLTVEQLTMLFRLMKDCKILIVPPRKDKQVHSFIVENFETVSGKTLSIKNVGKLFSSTDPNDLNFWIRKFKELSEKAEKK
jgi:hypothetical protein